MNYIYIMYTVRSGLGRCGAQWEKFRAAQIPSQLAPRYVGLNAGHDWEQMVQLD